jgi:hypothetical protein
MEQLGASWSDGLAVSAAERVFAGEDPRVRYLRACALRCVARGVASRDWRAALRIAARIDDDLVRGGAVVDILRVRLDHSAHGEDGELGALVAATDGLTERSRTDAYEVLLQRGAEGRSWSDFELADVVYRLAMGSRQAFLSVLGQLFELVRMQRPQLVEAFEVQAMREVLSA